MNAAWTCCTTPRRPANRFSTTWGYAGSIDEETSPLGARQWRRWLEETEIVVDELMVAELTGCTGHRTQCQGVVRFEFIFNGVAIRDPLG